MEGLPPLDWAVGMSLRILSWLMRGPIPLQAVVPSLAQAILGSIRNQTEQAKSNQATK